MTDTEELRSARHAALGDRVRLAIVDALTVSDLSPKELRSCFGLESNLLAHHLDVLEQVGLIYRSASSGDARRRYVHLHRESLSGLAPKECIEVGPALFLCTQNSARSQLAAALWQECSGRAAESAGTQPAQAVDPRAVAAAKRCGLQLQLSAPRNISQVRMKPELVITVCDKAHEDLASTSPPALSGRWLHWSISDPVELGTAKAFDAAVAELRCRVSAICESGGQAA